MQLRTISMIFTFDNKFDQTDEATNKKLILYKQVWKKGETGKIPINDNFDCLSVP
jgi:hypothetical protein